MKHLSLRRFFRHTGMLLLWGILTVQSALAQQYTLGPLDLISDHSLHASFRTALLSAEFGSFRFNKVVGGICFEQVGKPESALAGKPINLHLRNQRFEIDVAGQTCTPDLPLWQLLPIVNYVDSTAEVVFTAYGESLYPEKNVQFVYHPAFLDTLLGLRFCQADIIFNGMTGNLEGLWKRFLDPTWEMLVQLSGQDEPGLREMLATNYTNLGIPGVTAENAKEKWAEFTVQAAKLLFGEPEGYAWDLPREAGRVVSAPSEWNWLDPDREQKERIGKQLTEVLNNNETWNSYILTDHDRPISFALRNGTIEFTGRPCYRFTLLDEDTHTTRVCQQTSDLFDARWDLLKEYNPAVITAVENTAHWSAFFRYIKQNRPREWQHFKEELAGVASDAPEVSTPTRYGFRQQGLF